MGRPLQAIRKGIQVLWTLLTNSYLVGFVKGRIYTGPLKNGCVPGLNCYSCPGALGSCPIGAVQAVLSSSKYRFSFYLAGFFLIIGTLLGRVVCGFLCPFGLVQEILHRIPFVAKIKTFRGDRMLRYLKYGVLIIFVILMPLFLVDAVGQGQPWFCKLICPAGTLEGGIPLVLANRALQEVIGFLYAWKMGILGLTLFFSILIYRPFCKYICPLGAIYAFFNRVALYRYHIREDRCTHCNHCADVCPMNIHPQREVNHGECIRCGLCKEHCAFSAVESGISTGRNVFAKRDGRIANREAE